MKVCPHCGSDTFKGVVKRRGIFQFVKDPANENGLIVLKEDPKKIFCDVAVCNKCNAKVTNEQLVEDSKCSQCNTPTPQEELVNGLCYVCEAIKSRPDLATASKEDLIRRFLLAEKQLNSNLAVKTEKKVEASDKAEDKAEEVKNEPVKEEIKAEPTAEDIAKAKAKEAAAATRKANAEKAKAKAEADAKAKQVEPEDKAGEVASTGEDGLPPTDVLNEEEPF